MNSIKKKKSIYAGGHTDIVKLLIQHPDIRIDLADKEQRTALRAAAWSGHEDILKTLISAGADVNSVDKRKFFISFRLFSEILRNSSKLLYFSTS